MYSAILRAMRPPLLPRLLAAAGAALLAVAAHAADLTVSAAASLTNALRELGPAFEAQHPGTPVVFNFASSDALLVQIARGAPVDLFASADQDAMDRAGRQQLLAPGTRRNFVANTLVLVVPADSALGLKAAADLARPAVRRVAIGNPASVPACGAQSSPRRCSRRACARRSTTWRAARSRPASSTRPTPR